jgi:8-oxo-dGTP pyrophosphatase MutT (NUDIX family)
MTGQDRVSNGMTEIENGEGALRTREAVVTEPTPPGHAPRHRVQYAALPYRLQKDGQVEVLLITSRTSKRWIIPKGWPMGKRPPHKVAAQEAFEEAGIEGRAAKTALGVYHYEKLLSNGTLTPCRVEVFALKLEKEKAIWPERKQRKRCWLALEEAATLISDAELAPLIRSFVPR